MTNGKRTIFVSAVIVIALVALGLALPNTKLSLRDSFAPRVGALFGGAVNIDSERDNEISGNAEDVTSRQRQLCRKYDNLHFYLRGVAIGDSQLDNARWAINQNKTPVVTLSWPQRMPNNPAFIPQVAAGRFDSQIAKTAASIKGLGGQIILRPYWEFNHADNGLGAANYDGNYGKFITAWQRTHAIFFGDAELWQALDIGGTPVQAENVRFSWTPGSARPSNVVDGVNEDYRPYYPGDKYVDWIGIDSYTGNRMVFLSDIFTPPTQLVDWYATYSPLGKPMTISEVGIRPQSTYPNRSPSRPEWFADAQKALKEMPMIKLFSYFDVSNEVNPLAESYQVDAPGGSGADSSARSLAAYSELANDPYFRQGDRSPVCGADSDGSQTDRAPLGPADRKLTSGSLPRSVRRGTWRPRCQPHRRARPPAEC